MTYIQSLKTSFILKQLRWPLLLLTKSKISLQTKKLILLYFECTFEENKNKENITRYLPIDVSLLEYNEGINN